MVEVEVQLMVKCMNRRTTDYFGQWKWTRLQSKEKTPIERGVRTRWGSEMLNWNGTGGDDRLIYYSSRVEAASLAAVNTDRG
jgi:hypothetical protein